jgi:hypothetical protein
MVSPAIKVLTFLDQNHSQSPSVNDTAGSHCGYVKNLRVNLNYLALGDFFFIFILFFQTLINKIAQGEKLLYT